MRNPVSHLERNFALVGFPTWILVNAIFTELAYFADSLPEGYDVGVYLTTAFTVANVAPAVAHFFVRKQSQRQQRKNIMIINIAGMACSTLLALFWKYTVRIGDAEISLPLYVLAFMAGCVCTSTTVTHYAYVGNYRRSCTTALSFGAGLGSLFIGLVALMQYLLPSSFSVSEFFYISTACWICGFVGLKHIPQDVDECGTRKLLCGNDSDAEDENSSVASPRSASGEERPLVSVSVLVNEPSPELTSGGEPSEASSYGIRGPSSTASPNPNPNRDRLISRPSSGLDVCSLLLARFCTNYEILFLYTFRYFLLLQFAVSALGFGVIPALISVVCGRFSNSSALLIYATVLVCMFDPVARGLTHKYATKRFDLLAYVWGPLALLQLLCISVPSNSDLYTIEALGAIPVVAYVGFMSVFSYTYTCQFLYIHSSLEEMHSSQEFISLAYSWNGFISQGGAFVGTLITFVLTLAGVFR